MTNSSTTGLCSAVAEAEKSPGAEHQHACVGEHTLMLDLPAREISQLRKATACPRLEVWVPYSALWLR